MVRRIWQNNAPDKAIRDSHAILQKSPSALIFSMAEETNTFPITPIEAPRTNMRKFSLRSRAGSVFFLIFLIIVSDSQRLHINFLPKSP